MGSTPIIPTNLPKRQIQRVRLPSPPPIMGEKPNGIGAGAKGMALIV